MHRAPYHEPVHKQPHKNTKSNPKWRTDNLRPNKGATLIGPHQDPFLNSFPISTDGSSHRSSKMRKV